MKQDTFGMYVTKRITIRESDGAKVLTVTRTKLGMKQWKKGNQYPKVLFKNDFIGGVYELHINAPVHVTTTGSLYSSRSNVHPTVTISGPAARELMRPSCRGGMGGPLMISGCTAGVGGHITGQVKAGR